MTCGASFVHRYLLTKYYLEPEQPVQLAQFFGKQGGEEKKKGKKKKRKLWKMCGGLELCENRKKETLRENY